MDQRPNPSGNSRAPRRVAVIGAGVVGVSCALYLRRDGHEVTLIDPREPGTATSFGNSGGIVTTSCAPLALPGTLKKVPGMLLDPLGPMVVRWRYLPRIAPWLWALVQASRPARVEAIADALAELNGRTTEPWKDLARQAGADDLLRGVGWFKVFETDQGFAGNAAERDLLGQRGKPFQVLNSDEIRQLEPALAPIFKHGFLQQEAYFVANPGRMVSAMAADFLVNGGTHLRAEASGFELNDSGRRVLTTDDAVETDVIVLAAGAWSRGLAAQLGAKIPLDTERGYHVMLPTPDPGLRRPIVHGEQGFALSPLEHGLRLGSQVEFAGVDAPPDYRRIRSLLPRAKRMVPSLETEEQSIWMGRRPSLPDSLPVIGPAPGHKDVLLAFGHGHLGLTEGPLTGRIIADLLAGRDPGFDLSPFRANRFHGWLI